MNRYRYVNHRTGAVYECRATDIEAADECYQIATGADASRQPHVGVEITLDFDE